MPVVWKSYESMVRLVAAIVAAHPDMKLNYAAIAGKFGESTTPVAISHVMQRHIKSNPHANLDQSMADNGGGAPRSGGGRKKAAAPTPKKPRAKPTPKKRAMEDEDDEEDLSLLGNGSEDEIETPSKKSVLNRTQGGRITKTRKAAPAPGAYAGLNEASDIEEEEDDLPVFSSPIKQEPRHNGINNMNSSLSRTNGYTNGNNNGHSPLGYPNNGGQSNGLGHPFAATPTYHHGYSNGNSHNDYYTEQDETGEA